MFGLLTLLALLTISSMLLFGLATSEAFAGSEPISQFMEYYKDYSGTFLQTCELSYTIAFREQVINPHELTGIEGKLTFTVSKDTGLIGAIHKIIGIKSWPAIGIMSQSGGGDRTSYKINFATVGSENEPLPFARTYDCDGSNQNSETHKYGFCAVYNAVVTRRILNALLSDSAKIQFNEQDNSGNEVVSLHLTEKNPVAKDSGSLRDWGECMVELMNNSSAIAAGHAVK